MIFKILPFSKQEISIKIIDVSYTISTHFEKE